ncbi:hypothetical protein D3C72_1547010 [compost metagenome]
MHDLAVAQVEGGVDEGAVVAALDHVAGLKGAHELLAIRRRDGRDRILLAGLAEVHLHGQVGELVRERAQGLALDERAVDEAAASPREGGRGGGEVRIGSFVGVELGRELRDGGDQLVLILAGDAVGRQNVRLGASQVGSRKGSATAGEQGRGQNRREPNPSHRVTSRRNRETRDLSPAGR